MNGLTPIWRGHRCSKDNCTGYLCDNCHSKFGDSKDNTIKNMRQFRTGMLDPSSAQGKGFIGARIIAKTLGLDDCNIKTNNFNFYIDLSKHSVYGYIEVKTATFSRIDKTWNFNTNREQDYDTLVLICMDENWNDIERIYAIPWEYSIKRKHITIYENPSRYCWYEKFRIDEKLYNDIFHNMKIENCQVLKNRNI